MTSSWTRQAGPLNLHLCVSMSVRNKKLSYFPSFVSMAGRGGLQTSLKMGNSVSSYDACWFDLTVEMDSAAAEALEEGRIIVHRLFQEWK